jgi:hypothetical protein
MNLYCKLAFGQLHHRNPAVIQLAGSLDRSPNSVAMKLSNLASLDPAITSTGRRGLAGASNLDRAVWNEFNAGWTAVAAATEEQWAGRGLPALGIPDVKRSKTDRSSKPSAFPTADFDGDHEALRTVKVRLAQRFFRQAVLASYGCACCVTGNPVPALLTASHILPWAKHPEHQANPRNGLCLEKTLDAAFDRGLITFDKERRLVASRALRGFLPNRALERHVIEYEGTALRMPEKFWPSEEFLEQHRRTCFQG